MSAIPLLDLGADPEEAGHLHGTRMGQLVRANVDTYLRRFALSGIGRAEVMAEAARWLDFIAQDNRRYFDEMTAIAHGANLSGEEVAMLNARYEITYGLYAREAQAIAPGSMPEQEGCTLWGVLPTMTRSEHCMIGQNWDWLAGLRGHVLIKRVTRNGVPGKGLPDYVGFTEAGIVGCKIGVNAAGIGLCLAGLITEREGGTALRKPVHVRCAEVLDAWSFSEALRPVVATERLCSANFMIGDGTGEIINVEAMQDRCAYGHPGDDPDKAIVTHSNHLTIERGIKSEFERIAPSSLFRANRARRLMLAHAGRIDLPAIQSVMSDHLSHPSSICMHPDPALPPDRQNMTVASAVVDLTARRLWVSDGPPCEAEYHSYDLAEQPQLAEASA